MKSRASFLSRLLSVATAALVVFALVVPVAAVTVGTTVPTAYSPNVRITVSKTLTTATAGVFPDVSNFSFKLEPVSYTSAYDATTTDFYTQYTAATMPMPPAEAGIVVLGDDNTATITIGGFSADALGTEQLQSHTTGNITYTQAGIYTYRLTEIPHIPPVPGVTYDETVSYINVYVTNVLNEDGTPLLDENGKPVVNVSAITGWEDVNTTVTDMQSPDNPTGSAGKTTIVVPPDEDDGPREISYPFVNTYSTDDLVITKKVTGDLGDPYKDFNFTITLTNPSGQPDTRSFQYDIYTMGADGALNTADDAIVGGGTFAGPTQVIALKHNQYIVLHGLPVAEAISVTEAAYEGYTTTHYVGVGGTPVSSNAAVHQMAANAGNSIHFINHKQSSPPTGVTLDVLPYLLTTAVAGLGLLAVVKKRCRTDD